jgi:hypothetical protein
MVGSEKGFLERKPFLCLETMDSQYIVQSDHAKRHITDDISYVQVIQ